MLWSRAKMHPIRRSASTAHDADMRSLENRTAGASDVGGKWVAEYMRLLFGYYISYRVRKVGQNEWHSILVYEIMNNIAWRTKHSITILTGWTKRNTQKTLLQKMWAFHSGISPDLNENAAQRRQAERRKSVYRGRTTTPCSTFCAHAPLKSCESAWWWGSMSAK